jgi:hypothetical protein
VTFQVQNCLPPLAFTLPKNTETYVRGSLAADKTHEGLSYIFIYSTQIERQTGCLEAGKVLLLTTSRYGSVGSEATELFCIDID